MVNNIHRNERLQRKLTEKTTWFKQKPKNVGRKVIVRKKSRKTEKKKSDQSPITVLFVPRTNGGTLATQLREVDRKVSEVTKDRVKVVERAGVKLKELLHKSDPFGGLPCSRDRCLVCTNPYNEKFNCNKRNVTYKTFCLNCKTAAKDKSDTSDNVPIQTYYGETHVSAHERGVQHERDFRGQGEDSHMFKHYTECHSDMCQEDVKFGMTVIKQHFSSFSRQVHESILIFRDKQNVLNSRSMFNRCHVPRLTTMLDNEVEEKAPDVDKDFKLKRKRTGVISSGSGSSLKRPRVLSVTPDVAAQVVTVSSDQVQSSSTTSNKKHFQAFNSQRVSFDKIEDKLKPTKTAGATKLKLVNGTENNLSIRHFFKPVLGKAPADDNFYPPD